MRIAVLSETDSAEPRVAAVPETVKKFLALGADVTVQSGAGLKAGMPDSEYEAVGASVAASAEEAARDADLILVMEAGRIVEQGNHAELLAADGAYSAAASATSVTTRTNSLPVQRMTSSPWNA